MAKKTAMIHTRIDPILKKSAERIIAELGLSPTEAIRMYYAQIVLKKEIPFRLTLETDDTEENYIMVNDEAHLKELIGLQNVSSGNSQGCSKKS